MLRKPMILVFAGPNGAGKSTVTRGFREKSSLPGTYINADDIKVINSYSDITAAKEAERLREEIICSREDLTFETVLSTDRNLDLLKKAKSEGYFIKGFYVITVSPDINVQRVADRVADGGHDVPKKKIIDRYYRSKMRIPELVEICDVLHIYDNTNSEPQRIFKKKKNEITIFTNSVWSQSDITSLVGITNE